MKAIVAVAASLVAVLLWGTPAFAERVPERAIGIWSVAECDGDGLTVIVNRGGALVVEGGAGETGNVRVAVASAEWIGGSIVLTTKLDGEDILLPPLDDLKRCVSPPASLAVAFAETLAVFQRLDKIGTHCRDGVDLRCLVDAAEIIDVTDDGLFSKAEISRAIRAAGFFIGYRIATEETTDPFVPLEKLYLAQLGATALGPLVATNIIDSYDFDGDGFLSLDELMQDRVPEEGLEGVAATLLGEASPAVVSTLLESVSGAFDLMGALR